jgi:hypothetical protein
LIAPGHSFLLPSARRRERAETNKPPAGLDLKRTAQRRAFLASQRGAVRTSSSSLLGCHPVLTLTFNPQCAKFLSADVAPGAQIENVAKVLTALAFHGIAITSYHSSSGNLLPQEALPRGLPGREPRGRPHVSRLAIAHAFFTHRFAARSYLFFCIAATTGARSSEAFFRIGTRPMLGGAKTS